MVVLLLSAGALASELFLPGFIGLADNGDFPKVSMSLCIGAADDRAQAFSYFVSDYVRGNAYCWDSGLKSSAVVPAWFASTLEQAVGSPEKFDIRWLGGVNAALFLVFFYVLLIAIRTLEGWRWIAACILALWIFTDVSFVAYFNSFFADSAALLGAMIAAASALWLLAADETRLLPVCVFAGGALLFVTSKAQHAIYGFVPALLLAVLGYTAKKRAVRFTSWGAAGCLLASAAWMVASTPDWYKAQPRFNLIFSKIAKKSASPLDDFRELGLGAPDLKYIGTNAFAPGNPTENEQWLAAFCSRTGYGKLLAYYVRHPAMMFGLMHEALGPEGAASRRPWNLSNFRRAEGKPAGARTERFASWSRVRDWLSGVWPMHVAVWYALVLGGAVFVLRRRKSRFGVALAAATLGAAAIGLGEFSVAALADSLETHRHLLLFQLFTDLTIFFALVWALAGGARGPERV
jgi:hypothetical protein